MKRGGMSRIRALRHDEPVPGVAPRRYRNADGYVRLRWKVGPQQYVEEYEHRVAAGRPHPRLHVHHINGVKDDNRPENLQVLDPVAHGELHEVQARKADPSRGRRFGGHRSAEAQRKAQRRVERERAIADRTAEMKRLYGEGKSTTEIGALLGLHSSVVSRRLRAAGVLMRPRSVAEGEKLLRRSHQLVHARSGMRCESCGCDTKWVGSQVHHRMPRQMGGSRDEFVNLPANLLLLCSTCHSWAENNRERAVEWGYLIRRGTASPSFEPVLTADGWRRFDNDGGITDAYPTNHTAEKQRELDNHADQARLERTGAAA